MGIEKELYYRIGNAMVMIGALAGQVSELNYRVGELEKRLEEMKNDKDR